MNLNVKCYQNTLKYSKIVKYYYSSKSRVCISNIKHSCDAKVNFLRAQNHSNMMICCSRNICEYYQLKTVALLHIFVETKKTAFIWNITYSRLSLLIDLMHPWWIQVSKKNI